MGKVDDYISDTADGGGYSMRFAATLPVQYRLVRKKSGELVLQGDFAWDDGNSVGSDWQDIPTIEEADAEEADCEHKWISIANEVIESGEMCIECNAIRVTT